MTLHHGDCLDVMAGMEPESVDAIVTDPPYDLTGDRLGSLGQGPQLRQSPNRRKGGFMGKVWDGTGVAFRPETWEAAYRVAKPSAYLLAFGGTRTVHRMTCAIEDAGWIVRDMLVWCFASGFPKSRASLKPAYEPIILARKPGPLRMLAVDACRIPTNDAIHLPGPNNDKAWREMEGRTDYPDRAPFEQSPLGRWPANLILTDPVFDGGWEGVVGGGETASGKMMPTEVHGGERTVFGQDAFAGYTTIETYGDSGTYSRFFLIPKADRADREPVLGGLPVRRGGSMAGAETRPDRPTNHPERANFHPTVKPTELMRHLVRLVTPAGGVVLDPFLGSGTTALAAEMEGFRWIGIEREAEYVAIAEARLNGTQRGLGLPA